jgi:hypothetical protein
VAFTTDLVNVSPRGSVRLFVDGETHEVDHGGTLTVDPETAGEAPHWRKATEADGAALRVNPEALHWRVRAGDFEVFDLGTGLLAQSETWRKAGDDSEPADPTADGRGGTIDVAVQQQMLLDVQRQAEADAVHDDIASETETS